LFQREDTNQEKLDNLEWRYCYRSRY
jgi:hypothetical protein